MGQREEKVIEAGSVQHKDSINILQRLQNLLISHQFISVQNSIIVFKYCVKIELQSCNHRIRVLGYDPVTEGQEEEIVDSRFVD